MPRHLSSAFALVVLVGVLAACANDDPAASTTTDSSGPVRVEHMFGTTEIPGSPERVVALSGADADAATALGVPPVLVPQALGVDKGALPPWLAEAEGTGETQALPSVSNNDGKTEPPFEKIAAAEPDVILALNYAITETEYTKLSAIAPTVAPVIGDALDTWQDITMTTGDILGRSGEAEDLVAEVEAGVDTAAQENPELEGHTFVVSLLFSPDQFGVIVDPEESTVSMLTRLGLTLSPEVAELEANAGFAAEVSREKADLLDADVTLAYAPGEGVMDDYLGDPIVAGLDVVARDAFIGLEPQLWGAFRNPSVLTIPYALDEVVAQLSTLDLGE